MRLLTQNLKKAIARRREYRFCMRQATFKDHICAGKITIEHCFIFAGRQLNELWALISLCEYAHSVGPYQDTGILNKRKNAYISLMRATPKDLAKYSRRDFTQLKKYLTQKYE